MQFDDYQTSTRQFAVYPGLGENFVYPTLGLVGEAGEVAEKVKKLIRDKEAMVPTEVTPADKAEIQKELGDVLWYLTQIASELGLSLDDVATSNVEKIRSRRERNQQHGEGDNR